MKLTTVKQGARILDVTEGRVYEMIRTELLPPGVVVHLGRQIRIDQDALAEWIQAGGQALPGRWKRVPDESTSASTLPKPDDGDTRTVRHRGRRHNG